MGEVSGKAIYEIARIKLKHDEHLQHIPEEGLARSIAGTARSMGLRVV